MEPGRNIWTIGHSTHSLEVFLAILKSFNIELLADIRTFPGSRRYPHFNKETLAASLQENGISYIHVPELGGRRNPRPDSKNTGWRVAAFRGYADHMETEQFQNAIKELALIGMEKRVVYMCSEAVWWSCHRSLVSDHFKQEGWTVMHIMGIGKAEEHPFTKPARVVEGKLVYGKE